jgi:two-component system, chemotaxis family, CheB/CheR fusion protein
VTRVREGKTLHHPRTLRKPPARKPRSLETASPPARPRSALDEPDEALQGTPRAAGFPIVGVGASAGGLEAFSALLSHLPPNTGMAFVLVQHLDPKHESALSGLLGRTTTLPVSEVSQNLRVEPNRVYVIPPNRMLTIRDGVLNLTPRQSARRPQRSIDSFFEALATDQRERAIGVILSGTATDGTSGLEAIKAEGGLTFAQDSSARYDSMPRSAVAAGCVDFVLPPELIAAELVRISRHPSVVGAPWTSGDPGPARTESARGRRQAEEHAGDPSSSLAGFQRILALLRRHTGVDFSLYRSSTVQRRITRRTVLTKHHSLEDYARSLEDDANELDALYSDVLISVTSFFRNPEAFEVLREKVWPVLLEHTGDRPLRVWTLGCSTGQEAYSMAMGFVEATDSVPGGRGLQIFATDLNESLLEKARHGLYGRSIVRDLSPERLRRFFVEEEGGYRVGKSLREMVVFARQNVILDPPFSRLDVISCRNVLIYLEPELQRKVFPLFHYALKPGGFLFLGASESVGEFTELFDPVDKKHKVFRKTAPPGQSDRQGSRNEKPPAERIGRLPARSARANAGLLEATQGGTRGDLSAQREADRITVQEFAPPAVLVDGALQILQFRGPTARYLSPPSGKASLNVLKMARPGLMLPLRNAIHRAKKELVPIRLENIPLEGPHGIERLHLRVIPLKNVRETSFLIAFEDAGDPLRGAARPARVGGGASRAKVQERQFAELERELAETRDYLGAVLEQGEAANEELQASYEEVQSANEELQSINEELETSKEELESTNEELITVNEEMTTRNAELGQLNSDLVNLQEAAQATIVLVDRSLGIRRFSSLAEKQFGLLAADVGRSWTTVRHGLLLDGFDDLLRGVIDRAEAVEREVQGADGRWFSMRARPYVTAAGNVDGAVIVLVDIGQIKQGEEARSHLAAIVDSTEDAIVGFTLEGKVTSWNAAATRLLGHTASEMVGRAGGVLIPPERVDEEPRLFDRIRRGEVVDNYEAVRLRKDGALVDVSLTVSPIRDGADRIVGVSTIARDISERRRMTEQLSRSEARYRSLSKALTSVVWTTDASGGFVTQQDSWSKFTGQTWESYRGFGWVEALHPDDRERVRALWQAALARRAPYESEGRVWHALSGTYRHCEARAVAVFDADGSVREWIGQITDIDDRKQMEALRVRRGAEARQAAAVLRQADQRKDEFLAMLAHELRNPLAPMQNAVAILRHGQGTGLTDLSDGLSASTEDMDQLAIDTLERQTKQLVRLVDDLLDAGRVSTGKVRLRRQQVELGPLVAQASEAVRGLFDALDQRLVIEASAQPIFVSADPVRLAQVVGNLLTNASKFTDAGGRIEIGLAFESSPPGGDHGGAGGVVGPVAVLRVRDSGIGIAAEDLPHIFDMFVQVDTSLERPRTGLGIGLTLVRTLVGLHGGTTTVSSAGPGQGSEFVVRLPALLKRAAESEASAPVPSVLFQRRRVLIVDDNRDAATSLALLLRRAGHEIRTAFDGLEAVEVGNTFRPDVVLLDIGLPKLNGYDVARTMRLQAWGAAAILVALTGWGQDEDRRRSAEAGFDAHIVKPIDLAVLNEILSTSHGASGEPSAGGVSTTGRSSDIA